MLRAWLEKRLLRSWYNPKKKGLAILLLPFSAIFWLLVHVRYWLYQNKFIKTKSFPIPIIIVGNITVGGTGKTPLVIALVNFLKAQGYQPAVISRGYGVGKIDRAQRVSTDSDPALVGDEPVLIARHCACPVFVAADRCTAVSAVLAMSTADVIVSDDGLQHYRLGRTFEIVVIDGQRQLGNGLLLPAGPLREPVSRLQRSDAVVVSGGQPSVRGCFSLEVKPQALQNLVHPQQRIALELLQGKLVYAVAGIGNPERFFDLLTGSGILITRCVFPDHHKFVAADFQFIPQAAWVVMTEKDAIKCNAFASENFWFLPIEAIIPPLLAAQVLERLPKANQISVK